METRNISIQTMKSDEKYGSSNCLYNILNTVLNNKKEKLLRSSTLSDMSKIKSLKIEGTSSHLQPEKQIKSTGSPSKVHLQDKNIKIENKKVNVFNNIHIRAALIGTETK